MKYIIMFHYFTILAGIACASWLCVSGLSLSQLLVAFLFSLFGVWFGLTQRAVDGAKARQIWRDLESPRN